MAYADRRDGVRHELVERHETPVWVDHGESPRQWAVYYREKSIPPRQALLTGHAVKKDDAYRMLMEYYMEIEQLSWPEIELVAAAVGAGI